MNLSTASTPISPTSSFSPASTRHPPPQCCRPRPAASSIHTFPFTGTSLSSFHSRRIPLRRCSSKTAVNQPAAEEDIKVLTAARSIYNEIVILETPESKVLLLDSSHSVHSILNKGENNWTNSYWDEFASLPPIVPDGTIAIFGLGGGTAANLMLELWPSLRLEGWEIDEVLIHKSREYLGISELEKQRKAGGVLDIRIGDALSANASIAGGYAGIVVDLFADGKILQELEEVKTWMEIREKLMPNGRMMVNCGGVSNVNEGSFGWEQNYAITAMSKAFPPGELSWKLLPKGKGANFLALTGAFPDLPSWSAALPHELSSSVYQWRICLPSS